MDDQGKEKEFREAFNLFDENKDGKITREELKSVLTKLGETPTDQEVVDIINEVDLDENGTIDFNEFVIMMKKSENKKSIEAEFREAFNMFDANRDGLIDEKEMKRVMDTILEENLSEKDIKDMIREADLDGDGQINFQEFRLIMMPK